MIAGDDQRITCRIEGGDDARNLVIDRLPALRFFKLLGATCVEQDNDKLRVLSAKCCGRGVGDSSARRRTHDHVRTAEAGALGPGETTRDHGTAQSSCTDEVE